MKGYSVHGQSLECIHKCSYILKNQRPVKGRTYISKREESICLLLFLTLPPKQCRGSSKTPKKMQKLQKI